MKEEHKEILEETINPSVLGEVKNMITSFLDNDTAEKTIRLSNNKQVVVESTRYGYELSLYGNFIPQDNIKNLLVFNYINKTTLLEINNETSTLTIGTHTRVDSVFQELQKVVFDSIGKDLINQYEHIEVSDVDFIGKNMLVASKKGPVTKANRHAVHV